MRDGGERVRGRRGGAKGRRKKASMKRLEKRINLMYCEKSQPLARINEGGGEGTEQGRERHQRQGGRSIKKKTRGEKKEGDELLR